MRPHCVVNGESPNFCICFTFFLSLKKNENIITKICDDAPTSISWKCAIWYFPTFNWISQTPAFHIQTVWIELLLDHPLFREVQFFIEKKLAYLFLIWQIFHCLFDLVIEVWLSWGPNPHQLFNPPTFIVDLFPPQN